MNIHNLHFMKKVFLLLLTVTAFILQINAQTLSRKEQKSMQRLQKHINFLASDRLEGRATGTDGEKMSADYIAGQLKKNKIRPKGDSGSYFQNFDLVNLRVAKDSTSFIFNGISHTLFRDFYPISYTSNSKKVQGLLVNVNYGITAPELSYDDYKGKEVKGKVVLINISTPDSQQAHSRFINYLSLETRVKKAESLGAIGVVFINTGDKKDDPSGELSKNVKPSNIPVFFVKNAGLVYIPEVELPVSMKSDIFCVSVSAHNVVGFKNNNAKYTVVIGAHHDHLGRGEIKGSREPNSNEVHNGADDNASGVAALIELSKQLKKRKFKKYNYLYIGFSGEEMGLLGSKYFIENPTINLNTVSYMINMDMVGRLNQTLIINGTGTSPYWNQAIGMLREDSSTIKKIKTTESGIGASDHTSFYLAGIPSLHFFTGQHDEYHKPSDDINTLNLKGEVKVIAKIIRMIDLTPAKEKLVYTKTKDEDMRTSFKVTLGIMPDYAFDDEGVRIDGVKDGKPAFNAGLKKGDIIISLAGEKIPNIDVYMKVLSKLEKGQKAELIYARGGITYTTQIQF